MSELFKDRLNSEESIFLNSQLLDFDFQPKLILYRENQQQQIAFCIKPVLQRRNGTNMIIIGSPGIGKTVCLRNVLEELKSDYGNEVYCIYINCWKSNTPFKIASSICQQLNYKWIHNKSFDELMAEASAVINEKSAVFVLDEVDKLEDQSTIYTLLEDVFRKCLILITNNSEFMINLDSRVRSRLLPEVLEFKPYNKNETEGILKERLKYAFVPNCLEKGAFDLIVEKTFEMQDIRVGLFLIKDAGEIAEAESKKKILFENAKQAILKLDGFKKKDISDFEDSEKIILEIIKGNSGKTSKEIFELYGLKENKSYRTFQRKIKNLEKNGMICLKEVNKGFETGRITIIEYNTNKTLDEF